MRKKERKRVNESEIGCLSVCVGGGYVGVTKRERTISLNDYTLKKLTIFF
jgi:hypothetical protein